MYATFIIEITRKYTYLLNKSLKKRRVLYSMYCAWKSEKKERFFTYMYIN